MLAGADQNNTPRVSTRIGAKVEVVVAQIGKDAVFVGLDNKRAGFIERAELTSKEGELTVEVGSRITARVVEVDGKAGAVRLSPLVIRPAHDETAAAAPAVAEVVLAEGLRVKGQVTRVERYGVFVQITGTKGRQGRGLVPSSDTGTPRGADLNKVFPIGMELEAKIIKVEEDGKIRLSISALKVDEERSEYEAFHKGPKPAKNEGPPQPRLGTFGALLQAKLGKK